MNTVANIGAEQQAALAGRGERLCAVLIDSLLAFAAWSLTPNSILPLFIGEAGRAAANLEWIGYLTLFVLFVAQMALLLGCGQTIGKRLCAVRIVDALDSSAVGFVRVVLLRNVIPGMAKVAVTLWGNSFGYVELGWSVVLVDALWIFTPERRCLHDHMADTKVVRCAEGAE